MGPVVAGYSGDPTSSHAAVLTLLSLQGDWRSLEVCVWVGPTVLLWAPFSVLLLLLYWSVTALHYSCYSVSADRSCSTGGRVPAGSVALALGLPCAGHAVRWARSDWWQGLPSCGCGRVELALSGWYSGSRGRGAPSGCVCSGMMQLGWTGLAMGCCVQNTVELLMLAMDVPHMLEGSNGQEATGDVPHA